MGFYFTGLGQFTLRLASQAVAQPKATGQIQERLVVESLVLTGTGCPAADPKTASKPITVIANGQWIGKMTEAIGKICPETPRRSVAE